MTYFTMILGDFSAGSTLCWTHDTTTHEWTHINAVAASYGHHEIISKRTHIILNCSSCIDLISTNQPKLLVNHRVHPFLHPKSVLGFKKS